MAAAPAPAPALPNALTPAAYVGPAAAPAAALPAVPANLREINAGRGGDTSLNTTTVNALAPPPVITPGVQGPNADYQAQYAKSMAAARGAISAQMASQLAEIQAAQTAGTNMAGQMPAQYNALQGAEDKSLTGIAASADKGAAATGIKSLGGATGETNMIGGAGGLASAFEAGQAPLLAQGVQATATMNKNALAQAQAAANAQLDEQQASFNESQAAQQEQERYSTQQSDQAWARDPNNPDSPSYKAALTLKGLNPDGTPTQAAQTAAEMESTQAALDKQNVTAFTAAQAVQTRQSPMYKYIDSQLSKGTTSSQLFNNNELNDPGVRLALQVWEYDHGHDPSAVSGLTGRKN